MYKFQLRISTDFFSVENDELNSTTYRINPCQMDNSQKFSPSSCDCCVCCSCYLHFVTIDVNVVVSSASSLSIISFVCSFVVRSYNRLPSLSLMLLRKVLLFSLLFYCPYGTGCYWRWVRIRYLVIAVNVFVSSSSSSSRSCSLFVNRLLLLLLMMLFH